MPTADIPGGLFIYTFPASTIPGPTADRIYVSENPDMVHNDTKIFGIYINGNDPPEFTGVRPVIGPVTVGHTLTQVISKDLFTDPEGDDFNITLKLEPDVYGINYESNTEEFSFTPDDNDQTGIFTLVVIATDFIGNRGNFTIDFEVLENQSPRALKHEFSASAMVGFEMNYWIPKEYFFDEEGDEIFYYFSSWYNTGVPGDTPWYTFSQNDTHVLLSGTPDAYHIGNETQALSFNNGIEHQSSSGVLVTIEVMSNPTPYTFIGEYPQTLIVSEPWEYKFYFSYIQQAVSGID